ncbi:hypothetical protein M9Y10_008642 [Tritrichomonas musculus]|uniref:Uncharacterized protein n=1 Tax=Tritrichomonas musculus TaxID=1915356 RepID=A0ABR2IYQ8_9EUKA
MNHHQLYDTKKEQIAFIKKQILNLSQQLMKEQHYYKTYGYSYHNYNLDIAPSEIIKESDISRSKLLALSLQTVHSLDVAPENKPKSNETQKSQSIDLKLRWKKLYRTIKRKHVEENKNAYFIQTIWKRANGKSDSEFTPPDLHMFFQLDLEDYQQAELKAIHDISDEILHLSLQSILYEDQEGEEEEEDEGELEEETEASTDIEDEKGVDSAEEE